MANIAEGFEKGTDAEFNRYLAISKASCAELRSHLYIALDVGYIDANRFGELVLLAQEVSKVVGGLKSAVNRHKGV